MAGNAFLVEDGFYLCIVVHRGIGEKQEIGGTQNKDTTEGEKVFFVKMGWHMAFIGNVGLVLF
jgi:hypothetical protein